MPGSLFRAFSPEGGGWPLLTTNNPNLTIPHAQTTSTAVQPFYSTPKKVFRQMAAARYGEGHEPLPPLSSWAASVHFVLSNASSMGPAAYFAIIDSAKLDGDVLVWHIPHILHGCDHEFLAYNIIKGNGNEAEMLCKRLPNKY